MAYGAEKSFKKSLRDQQEDRELQTSQTIRAHDVVVVESISLGPQYVGHFKSDSILHQKQIKFVFKEQMDTETNWSSHAANDECDCGTRRNLLADRVKEGCGQSSAWRDSWPTTNRPEKLDIAIRMYQSGDYSVKEILAATKFPQELYHEVNRLKLKAKRKMTHLLLTTDF